jgi:death-on-curing protein
VIWIGHAVVLAIHEEQIAEHGGALGIRDIGLLDSALARPPNRLSYEEPDIAALAASCGFGLARNHPFIDGNKRVSLVVTELFLQLNGYDLLAGDAECLLTWLGLAEGRVIESELAEWLRGNIAAAAA